MTKSGEIRDDTHGVTALTVGESRAASLISDVATRGRHDLQILRDGASAIHKPDLSCRWQTEEESPSEPGTWAIIVQATRVRGEEILGWGWVPMLDMDAIATVSFHRKPATILLRTLYSAFAALENPNEYLRQVELGWTLGVRAPSAGVVGSAQDYGSAQVYVDWGKEPRYATFMIDPPDSPRIHTVVGIHAVSHLVQITTEAFRALDWPIPP